MIILGCAVLCCTVSIINGQGGKKKPSSLYFYVYLLFYNLESSDIWRINDLYNFQIKIYNMNHSIMFQNTKLAMRRKLTQKWKFARRKLSRFILLLLNQSARKSVTENGRNNVTSSPFGKPLSLMIVSLVVLCLKNAMDLEYYRQTLTKGWLWKLQLY